MKSGLGTVFTLTLLSQKIVHYHFILNVKTCFQKKCQFQPETIPQSTIHINSATEVNLAENHTGHQYSIVVKNEEQTIYFKATCHEETKMWINSLSLFTSCKVRKNLFSYFF